MAIEEVTKIFYRCSVCRKEYKTQEEAEKYCGSYKLEESKFAVGMTVTTPYPIHCGSGCGRWWTPTGKILRICGPIIGYFVTPEGEWGSEGHIYWYEVECRCLNCARLRDSPMYYTSDLKVAISEFAGQM